MSANNYFIETEIVDRNKSTSEVDGNLLTLYGLVSGSTVVNSDDTTPDTPMVGQFEFSNNGRYKHEFKQINLIGKGSFGKVYKVVNDFDGQYYAMKKLLLNRLSNEMKIKGLEELKIMAKLESDHVVHYKSSWIENNEYLFIQMELCLYTLKDIVIKLRTDFNRKPFEIMDPIEYYITSQLFYEILESVNYLHTFKPPIIHRDLKPTNILITNGSNGRFIKIGDFGLASAHEYEEQTHTQGSGSLRFAAPEVLFGRHYDTKSDIYSLGVITQDIFDVDIDS